MASLQAEQRPTTTQRKPALTSRATHREDARLGTKHTRKSTQPDACSQPVGRYAEILAQCQQRLHAQQPAERAGPDTRQAHSQAMASTRGDGDASGWPLVRAPPAQTRHRGAHRCQRTTTADAKRPKELLYTDSRRSGYSEMSGPLRSSCNQIVAIQEARVVRIPQAPFSVRRPSQPAATLYLLKDTAECNSASSPVLHAAVCPRSVDACASELAILRMQMFIWLAVHVTAPNGIRALHQLTAG